MLTTYRQRPRGGGYGGKYMFKFKALCAGLLAALLLSGLIAPHFAVCGSGKNAKNDGYVGGRVAKLAVLTADCSMDAADMESVAAATDVRVGSRILELLFGKDESRERVLIPCGDVFGAAIKQRYVTVTDATGLPSVAVGDAIIEIDGRAVSSIADVKSALAASGGEAVALKLRGRGGERTVVAVPQLRDGEYRLGISLRDSAAGIGTVTFIDPKSGAFGGLGHGICDGESGEIIEMRGGDVTGVILGGLHRGASGRPGELSGVLTDEDLGDLTANNACGVFGVIEKPEKLDTGAAIPVGRRDEVQIGEATVISTVKNGRRAEYKIEITEIDRGSDGSKSFRIRVTDPTLIAITGGIVRGMSGSPIIQNGKLVGAVTHVMVADPTEGYGIFIENMLNASREARNELPKAA